LHFAIIVNLLQHPSNLHLIEKDKDVAFCIYSGPTDNSIFPLNALF